MNQSKRINRCSIEKIFQIFPENKTTQFWYNRINAQENNQTKNYSPILICQGI